MAAPSLQEFNAWVRGVMGVPVSALPDDAPVIAYVYDLTAEQLEPLRGFFYEMPSTWNALFFNSGGSLLLNNAPDVAGSEFFATLRKTFGTSNLVAGVVSSTGDEATNTTLQVGRAMSDLSLADLQMLKDPYGRKALAILMELGPLWGIS